MSCSRSEGSCVARSYRFELIDGFGKTFWRREKGLLDDLAALDLGQMIAAWSAVEIWDGSRKVARVKKNNAKLNEIDSASL